MADKLLI